MKNSLWVGVWAGVVLLWLATKAGAEMGVTNLVVAQRPGTKIADITYDVSNTVTGNVWVSLAVNNAGTPVVATNLTGDVGSVSPGTGKSIAWDMGADWNGNFALLSFTLTTEGQTYMVIDLSSGSSSTNYPVTYLDAVPAGGWGNEYKTTKLALRWILGGSFTMGSPSNELGRVTNETQHLVTLTQPFYMGVFEVSQKQWEQVKGSWPSYYTNASVRESRPVEQVSYNDIRGVSAGAGWPANNNVDTTSFMGKLRTRTGQAFDLPTESQWEYAGRAGTDTALNSGYNLINTTEDPRMDEVGRYVFNSSGSISPNVGLVGGSAKVGSYLPSAWGLYDIHGNVYEWCLDWWGEFPGTVSDPKGAVSGSNRVVRGGCMGDRAEYCRSAYRFYSTAYYKNPGLGFRVVKTLP